MTTIYLTATCTVAFSCVLLFFNFYEHPSNIGLLFAALKLPFSTKKHNEIPYANPQKRDGINSSMDRRCIFKELSHCETGLEHWHTGYKIDYIEIGEVESNITAASTYYETRNIQDGFPFLFQHPKTGTKAIICLPQKVGSTTWKQAFVKTMGGNIYNWNPELRLKTSRDEFQNALMNSTVKRFMFVRNPYSRLLSAYLDKVILQHKAGVYPYRYKPSSGFSGFLAALRNENRRGIFTRYTYAPLSKLCELPKGMKYDYYLKIEQMQYWYRPFINFLNMQASVSSGWNFTTKWFRGGNQTCFYVSPGQTCDRMFDNTYSLDRSKNSAAVTSEVEPLREITPKSFHATESNLQLGLFYNTFLVGTLVNNIARQDFKEFHYPLWNYEKESSHEYIVKVMQLNHN